MRGSKNNKEDLFNDLSYFFDIIYSMKYRIYKKIELIQYDHKNEKVFEPSISKGIYYIYKYFVHLVNLIIYLNIK